MWNIQPGGEELVALEKSSAEESNMNWGEPFHSIGRASSAKTNALCSTVVFLSGLLAILVLCVARLTAQQKTEQNVLAPKPANSGPSEDVLRRIYPNMPPNQDPEAVTLGKDLYKRLSDMGEHWNRAGRSLERAVEAYNSAVG